MLCWMRILHCVKGREMLRLFSDKDRSVNIFSNNNLFANSCIGKVIFYLSSKFKLSYIVGLFIAVL